MSKGHSIKIHICPSPKDKMNEDVVLTENFTLGKDYRTSHKTTLTKKEISYEDTSTKRVNKISLDDVVGARISENEEKNFIHVISYPLKSSKFSKIARRRRTEHVFCVENSEDVNENRTLAKKWVKFINLAISNVRDKEGELIQLQFLVFVNPFGGQGSAYKLFNKKVKPMLDDAQVEYKVKITEYAGHAKELVQVLDVSNLDCILCCSGDGLIYEVVNGLMSRPDWEDVIKTPVGHIPCGSGNGLCSAALHHSREGFDFTSSVFTVLRGSPVPLDIVKAETSSSVIHYSFLGIVHGLIADVDVDSEKYRYMGELRFTLMALNKIAKRQCFSGKVWYLPVEDDFVDCQEQAGPTQKTENCSQSHEQGDGTKASVSNIRFDEEAMGDRLESACDRLAENGISKGYHGNMYLPGMQEPLPETWRYIEGDFMGWLFVTLSHIGKGAFVAPEANLGGGVIYMIYLTDDITRKTLLDMMAKIEDGSYVGLHGVHIVKAKAFRYEPSPTALPKNVTIDGELVGFGQIQAEIYKGLGRVRCL